MKHFISLAISTLLFCTACANSNLKGNFMLSVKTNLPTDDLLDFSFNLYGKNLKKPIHGSISEDTGIIKFQNVSTGKYFLEWSMNEESIEKECLGYSELTVTKDKQVQQIKIPKNNIDIFCTFKKKPPLWGAPHNSYAIMRIEKLGKSDELDERFKIFIYFTLDVDKYWKGQLEYISPAKYKLTIIDKKGKDVASKIIDVTEKAIKKEDIKVQFP